MSAKKILAVTLLLFLGAGNPARGQISIISTPYAFTNFAGNPAQPGTNDGPLTTARFNAPVGLAMDDARNIYLTDTSTNATAIRKIGTDGLVTTITTNLMPLGFGKFALMHGLALDKASNIYVTLPDHTVRKVTPDGQVLLFAGKPGQSGSLDGVGEAARFFNPAGLVADREGNLYVGDSSNFTIRKVSAEGKVTTLAGVAGVSGYRDGAGPLAMFAGVSCCTSALSALAVDNLDNLYVVNIWFIRKVTPSGLVSTIAGGGSGLVDGKGRSASFGAGFGGEVSSTFAPDGIAADFAGNLYVADTPNNAIRRVRPNGDVTTLGGGPFSSGFADGVGPTASFNQPEGLVIDKQGNLYVADSGNHRITKGTQAYFAFGNGSPDLTVSPISVQTRLTGPSGSNVLVETSSNLKSWLPLATNQVPPGGLGLTAPLGSEHRQFFRARTTTN